ncbi:MAG: hypothetical protein ACLR1V_06275 [Coprococcus sp.]
MIKHIWAVYFSPSGKTEQVTMAVAEGAAGVLNIGKIHQYDFTLPDKREHHVLLWGERFGHFGMSDVCRTDSKQNHALYS